MDNKEIIIGIIAVVVIVAAAYVYLGSQNAATQSGVSDAQLNAAVSEADNAVAQMDNVTGELSDINSQDMNSSVTDTVG
jgi:hypothetical protein